MILKRDRDGVDGGLRILPEFNRVVLVTPEKKIIDQQIFDAKKVWFTTEFLHSATERTILLSQENKSQPGEVSAQLFDLHAGKLEAESYRDVTSDNADHLMLVEGKYASWRLSLESPHDILQVSAVPGSAQVNYIRYHFEGAEKGWVRSVWGEAGNWVTGQPFPAAGKFPPAGSIKTP